MRRVKSGFVSSVKKAGGCQLNDAMEGVGTKMQGKVRAGTSWVIEDNEYRFSDVVFQVLMGQEGRNAQKIEGYTGPELKKQG